MARDGDFNLERKLNHSEAILNLMKDSNPADYVGIPEQAPFLVHFLWQDAVPLG